MNVHVSALSECLSEGWVEVGRKTHTYNGESFVRVDLAHPSRTCLKPLRDGPCLMDLDHRGRCSTVVFYCDGCGNTRRGQPDGKLVDDNGDTLVVLCWVCNNIRNAGS